MTNLTEMQSKSLEAAQLIVSTQYYPHILEQVLQKRNLGMTNLSEIAQLADSVLYTLWNQFWALLPDSRAIQRDPFFAICDLAEGTYMVNEDDTQ